MKWSIDVMTYVRRMALLSLRLSNAGRGKARAGLASTRWRAGTACLEAWPKVLWVVILSIFTLSGLSSFHPLASFSDAFHAIRRLPSSGLARLRTSGIMISRIWSRSSISIGIPSIKSKYSCSASASCLAAILEAFVSCSFFFLSSAKAVNLSFPRPSLSSSWGQFL